MRVNNPYITYSTIPKELLDDGPNVLQLNLRFKPRLTLRVGLDGVEADGMRLCPRQSAETAPSLFGFPPLVKQRLRCAAMAPLPTASPHRDELDTDRNQGGLAKLERSP